MKTPNQSLQPTPQAAVADLKRSAKMKTLLVTLCAVALSMFVAPVLRAGDADGALAAAKDFAHAIQTKDFSRVADLADLEQLRAVGGRDKLIEALKKAEDVRTVRVMNVSFTGKTERIPANHATIYRVDDAFLARYKEKTTIRISTFYLVYRIQGEASWHVIDGSNFTVAQLAKQFSGIPEGTTFPKVVAEIVKEEPNQTLQHNDHVCHGSCWRTLRASHDRG